MKLYSFAQLSPVTTRLAPAICSCLLLSYIATVDAIPRYTWKDVGDLGGLSTYGYGINNNGEIAGYGIQSPGGSARGFYYSGSALQALDTLGGLRSFAFDINDDSWITGAAQNTDGYIRAFVYNGSSMQDIGTLGGYESEGRGINSSGQVTGQSAVLGDLSYHAFLYDGQSMTDLGTLPGGRLSSGIGINDFGVVVGFAESPARDGFHAFRFETGQMFDLGTLGGRDSFAYAINNFGLVVGTSNTSAPHTEHAFIHDGVSMRSIGTLGGLSSFALGINDAGIVVGGSLLEGNAIQNAFVFDGTQMYNLNHLLIDMMDGVSIELQSSAWGGINESGQIVARGIYTSGGVKGQRTFILTPVELPEIDSASLVCIGFFALFASGCTRLRRTGPKLPDFHRVARICTTAFCSLAISFDSDIDDYTRSSFRV